MVSTPSDITLHIFIFPDNRLPTRARIKCSQALTEMFLRCFSTFYREQGVYSLAQRLFIQKSSAQLQVWPTPKPHLGLKALQADDVLVGG